MGKLARGELLLAAFFGVVGIVWAVIAASMKLWEGFAPSSGFLPLIYGLLLAGLSAAIAADLLRGPRNAEERPPVGKPLVLLLVLAATVVGIGVVGFAISVFLMLLFLYAVLERLPWHWSLVASLATTAALVVIFKVWLSVPLPLGPIGI
jgi:hypothetical protein